ncbi:MAG TPA: YbhB/YbcL family Raf kinase inhibitor-like protein [Steroidobacteraceae bacterium]|jgi:Raf kinase inhibitor-like YbhB/YbcL family protein|nr:YbhB/YbcL family Raf kinase inhibitor-like protein [Steroidobacteraceae bacterium]
MGRTWRRAGAWLAAAILAATYLLAAQPPAAAQTGAMAKFTLSSSDFTDGGTIANAQVFNGFDCKGGNVSPALKWSGAPAGTMSFALMVHDPDAPTGSGWWHWIVYNIPAGTTALPAGAGDPAKHLLPAGVVQGRTDYGTAGYGGPCPPPGKPHHYYFRLYALKVAKLEVPADAGAALIGFNVRAQELGHAELLGMYGR